MGSVCCCLKPYILNNERKLITLKTWKIKEILCEESFTPIEMNHLLENDFLVIENSENDINFSEIKELGFTDEKRNLKDSMFPQEDESTWFLPQCSRDNAERLLRGRRDGTFLVRGSMQLEGKYILSIVIRGHIKHCVINKNDKGYSLYGSQSHPTLMSLILYYATPHQTNSSSNSCSNLYYPIFY